MADFTSIAEMMQSCAADAVRVAQDRFGFTLDFSDRSIESLETVLAAIGTTLDVSDKNAVDQAVKMWGSYLGETVCRVCGGAWELVQYPGRAAAVPTLVVGGSQLYPLMKVFRRLTMGEPENVWKFYEKIRGRLCPVLPTDARAR